MSDWTPERDALYFAVSCRLLRNRKVEQLSHAAVVLYVAGLAHCYEDLTDGVIREAALGYVLADARATRRQVKALADAGLWITREDGGYEVNDYLKWNPSKAHVQARRNAEKARKQGQRKRLKQATNSHVSHRDNHPDDPPGVQPLRVRDREKSFTRGPETIARGAFGPRSTMSGHQCPHCGVTLRTRQDLADHIARHHVAA